MVARGGGGGGAAPPQVVHCLQLLASTRASSSLAGGSGSAAQAPPLLCMLGCGAQLHLKGGSGGVDGPSAALAAMLHAAEAHAGHVLELSGSAAGPALPQGD